MDEICEQLKFTKVVETTIEDELCLELDNLVVIPNYLVLKKNIEIGYKLLKEYDSSMHKQYIKDAIFRYKIYIEKINFDVDIYLSSIKENILKVLNDERSIKDIFIIDVSIFLYIDYIHIGSYNIDELYKLYLEQLVPDIDILKKNIEIGYKLLKEYDSSIHKQYIKDAIFRYNIYIEKINLDTDEYTYEIREKMNNVLVTNNKKIEDIFIIDVIIFLYLHNIYIGSYNIDELYKLYLEQ
jgi:hypothetical protein